MNEGLSASLLRRFHIGARLGRGYAGTSFLARRRGTDDRDLVLKVLDRRVLACSAAAMRAVEQALELQRLRTPAHLRIPHRWEVAEPDPWIVGRFVPGASLAQRRPQGERAIIDCLVQTASALMSLHDAGLVHGLLQPANVVVSATGVTLTDAGLHPLMGGLHADSAVAGTYPFLSPEHLGAVRFEVGPAADLYSLGIIGWTLFEGHPPFVADTAAHLIAQHAATEAPPALRAPPPVRDLIARLLDKRPQARGTTRDALRDLEMALGVGQAVAPPVPPELRRRLERLATAVVNGEARATVVTGDDAAVRSAVLDAADAVAEAAGMVVCRPAARPRHPYETIAAALGRVHEALRQASSAVGEAVRQAVRHDLGGYAPLLSFIFPEIEDLVGPASARPPEAAPVVEATVRLMGALARHWRPIALVFTDLGEVDASSLELLRRFSVSLPDAPLWLLCGALEANGLGPQAETVRAAPDPQAEQAPPAEGPVARLSDLSADARAMVEMGALCETRFDGAVVAEAARVEGGDDALDEAARMGLVMRSGAAWQFTREQARGAVDAGIAPAARARMHLQLAETLERRGIGDPFTLARHYELAGDDARALRWLRAAASDARRRCAWPDLVALSGRALRIASDVPATLQHAEGLFHLGRFEEAVTALETRLACTCSVADQARMLELLARSVHAANDHPRARAVLADALRALGEHVPERMGVDTMRALAGCLIHPLLWRHVPNDATQRRLALRLWNHASIYWHFEDHGISMHAQLQAMRLAHGLEACEEAALARGTHAVVCAGLGLRRALRSSGRRALALARQVGTRQAEASALSMYVCGLFSADAYAEAAPLAERAVSVCREAGDYWQSAASRCVAMFSNLELGRTAAARSQAEEPLPPALARNDQARLINDTVMARLALLRGDLEEASMLADACLERAPTQDRAMRILARCVPARLALARGDVAGALRILMPAVAEMRAEWMGQGLAMDAPSLLLDAHATACESDPRAWPAAEEACRSLTVLAYMHPALKVRIDRTRAVLAAARGRAHEADRAFTRAVKRARRMHLRHQEGLTQLARGRALMGQEDERAQLVLLDAEAILQEVDDRPALQVTRRLLGLSVAPTAPIVLDAGGVALRVRRQRVLELSREIAAHLELEALLPVILRSAIEVSGARRVAVLMDEEVTRAPLIMLHEGRPYVLAGALGDFDAPLMLELVADCLSQESAAFRAFPPGLALPLIPRLGVLYLDGGRIGDLEAGEARDLVEALAGLCAVALQNAVWLRRVERQHAAIVLEKERRLEARLDAQAADERREVLARFLAIASHDLKSPLQAISMSCEALRSGADVDVHASRVQQACRHALDLIAGYLDGMETEAGRALRLNRTEVDVGALVDREIDLQWASMSASRKKAVRVERRVDEGLIAHADETRLRQAAGNLVSNALKYSPVGGLVTVVVTRRESQLRVRVHDQGAPIDDVARLLDPFERGRGDVEGRGLGLWITRLIIEAHGGTLHVDREAGGNCFWFALPDA